jgi:hypothetical protein
MSIDLAAGIFAITGLSVSSSLVGRWVGLKWIHRRQLVLLLSIFVTLAFAWSMAGKLFWATLVPAPSVVFWANLMPMLLAFTAGISSTVISRHRWGTVASLAAMSAAYLLTPVARPMVSPAAIAVVSQWRDDVCLQSHPSTCAPAAAATLLRSFGIKADERMLLQPCLTSEFGTEPLGLYRGLAVVSGPRSVQPTVV